MGEYGFDLTGEIEFKSREEMEVRLVLMGYGKEAASKEERWVCLKDYSKAYVEEKDGKFVVRLF